ncbi:MAG: HIT family protein [Bacteroidetes bacterium]|nr:HIT family protein [Bacteroidota bacterium]
MSTVFTRIINGEIPCYRVAENYKFIAFLDINPLKEGHTLIVPKKEVDYFFDLDDETISEMTVFARRVAIAIREVIPCNRVGVVVLGLEVPHAHIHLIPMDSERDISFLNPRLKPTPERFREIAALIEGKVNLRD